MVCHQSITQRQCRCRDNLRFSVKLHLFLFIHASCKLLLEARPRAVDYQCCSLRSMDYRGAHKKCKEEQAGIEQSAQWLQEAQLS